MSCSATTISSSSNFASIFVGALPCLTNQEARAVTGSWGQHPVPFTHCPTRCIHSLASAADPLPQEAACVTPANHERQSEELRSRCPRLHAQMTRHHPLLRGHDQLGLQSVRP